MSKSINKVVEVCNSKFEEFNNIYSQNNSHSSIFVSYFGELSQEMVNDLSVKAEDNMIENGDKKGVIKRLFNILVEGLQNIRLHGARDEDGNQTSFLNIAKEDDHYKILMGNLILNKNVNEIAEKINTINSSSFDDVKKMYVTTLTNGIISRKGGAGLGFITMAMKSKNKLEFQFNNINDNISCFSVVITLNRN